MWITAVVIQDKRPKRRLDLTWDENISTHLHMKAYYKSDSHL